MSHHSHSLAGNKARLTRWLRAGFPLPTYVLNNLNRGLGFADGYPFILSNTVIEKGTASLMHAVLRIAVFGLKHTEPQIEVRNRVGPG